jgi:hypothetical protein
MPLVNIADPNCLLPEMLIIDASLLLEVRLNTKSSKAPTVIQFTQRLNAEATAQRILCVAPPSTFEECYFKLIQNEYSKAAQPLGIPWHEHYKRNPHLIQTFLPMLQRFRTGLQAIPIIPLDPKDLIVSSGVPLPSLEERMFHHMGAATILSSDAYLLAIAERLSAPHIATLDRDFRRANSWLHIYTII